MGFLRLKEMTAKFICMYIAKPYTLEKKNFDRLPGGVVAFTNVSQFEEIQRLFKAELYAESENQLLPILNY